MTNSITRRPQLLIVVLAASLLFLQIVFGADISVSEEQGERVGTGSVAEQTEQARLLVENQKQEWIDSLPGSYLDETVSFGEGGDEYLIDEPYTIVYSGGNTVTVSLRQMVGTGVLGEFKDSTTYPRLDDGSTMQDSSPKPDSLYGTRYWNENIGNGELNGVLFTFSGSFDGFGAWFGDLESRTDGEGESGVIYLYDQNENIISMQIIEPTIEDQSYCGGDIASNSISACGNETTRRIGFQQDEDEVVKHMLVVVGDDDWEGEESAIDGTREHISFIGPTFIRGCPDSDMDGVCDSVDACPNNASSSSDAVCPCGAEFANLVGSSCESDPNECGATGTGVYDCFGVCAAEIPELFDEYGMSCESESNECGYRSVGEILCDGSCSATVPLEPKTYGDVCFTEENICGMSDEGTVTCEGLCSAESPSNDLCEEEEIGGEEEDSEVEGGEEIVSENTSDGQGTIEENDDSIPLDEIDCYPFCSDEEVDSSEESESESTIVLPDSLPETGGVGESLICPRYPLRIYV